MKRLKQYLIVACLAAWLCGGNALAYTLSFEDGGAGTEGFAGDEITLNVMLNLEEGEDPISADFDIFFTSADLQYSAASFPTDTNPSTDWAASSVSTPDDVLVSYSAYRMTPLNAGTYTLSTIGFTIKNTSATTTSLTFQYASSYDEAGSLIKSLGLVSNNTGDPLSGSAQGIDITIKHQPNPVPVPSTLLLLGTGLAGLAALGRRRQGALAS